MSVFQRWIPLALFALCVGCGDDSALDPSAHLDSSVDPIENEGDAASDEDEGVDERDTTPEDAGSPQHDDGAVIEGDATTPLPKPDAGRPTDAGDDDASTQPPPGEGQPIFVAVGYGGRRVRSTDLGLTWTDEEFLDPAKRGGDDEYLLRAVTYAKGVFVAVGWKIVTSKDGRAGTWTDHTMRGQQWLGGIQYGNDRFVATGGYGYSARSTDGLSWSVAGDLNTQASRSLAFGDGKFMSATDNGNWWTSTDGSSWAVASSGHGTQVAYCGTFKDVGDCAGTFVARNRAVGEGVTVRTNSRGGLERSTDGVNFTSVLNSGLGFEAVTFGYVE